MPRAATTRGLDEGEKAEVRVAQAWFWDGIYVRRSVNLQQRYGRDALTVTDLDLLGYLFTPALTNQKYIGEVKSGRANNTPRPLDRALWVRGLRELVQADRAEVTTAFNAGVEVRQLAHTFGVTIQHFDDLTAREQRLEVAEVADSGSQGETIAAVIKRAQAKLKGNLELERAFWFLRSEVWFLDPLDGAKRNIGLLRRLKSVWSNRLDEADLEALKWLYAEAISVFGLQLAQISGLAVTMDSASFRAIAKGRLSVGDVPLSAMLSLSERVDSYVTSLLKQTNATVALKTEAIGAFLPTEPNYTEPLLELIERLTSRTGVTSRLPRQLDLIIFERLVRGRQVQLSLLRKLGFGSAAEQTVRLVGAFLRGQVGLPAEVDRALSGPAAGGTLLNQTTLFDSAHHEELPQGDAE